MSTTSVISETTTAPDPGAATLGVYGISKSFGPTRAVAEASFDLQAGEVHAIVGENGSGKSTIVKILAGVHRPDSGELRLGGEAIRYLGGPPAAQAAGIATVFQEVLVVEPRSVLENVWLGSDGAWRACAPAAVKRQRADDLLTELIGAPLALDARIGDLSLSNRQACCIARALVRHPKVLILDEATSALDVGTRDRLFEIVGRLTADGAAVLFISHRMDEIAEIADRVTVMRSGETVATLDREAAAPETLVRLMTGGDHLVQGSVRHGGRKTGDPVLRAHNLRLRDGRSTCDFELRAGEIVGLAGLESQGQDVFLRALWGFGPAAGRITRVEGESEHVIESSADAAEHGIAYVPRERRAESLFAARSVRENFGIVTMARDVRRGLLRTSETRRRLATYVDQLDIRMGEPEAEITTLSGGNQQKIVIARWLATDPQVLLLNDPTRGIDIGAKRDLYAVLEALAGRGMAVVMLSTEVDEHIELMDRVLVFRDGELADQLPAAELSREALVSAFFGGADG
jgi:ABC-type sugar transport system ATPase subunit